MLNFAVEVPGKDTGHWVQMAVDVVHVMDQQKKTHNFREVKSERGVKMEPFHPGMLFGRLAVEASMRGSPWIGETSRSVEKFPDTAHSCRFMEVAQAIHRQIRGQRSP